MEQTEISNFPNVTGESIILRVHFSILCASLLACWEIEFIRNNSGYNFYLKMSQDPADLDCARGKIKCNSYRRDISSRKFEKSHNQGRRSSRFVQSALSLLRHFPSMARLLRQFSPSFVQFSYHTSLSSRTILSSSVLLCSRKPRLHVESAMLKKHFNVPPPYSEVKKIFPALQILESRKREVSLLYP